MNCWVWSSTGPVGLKFTGNHSYHFQFSVDSEDDYRTDCRNVSHCQQQQSYSELRSPGRSNSTYFWNDSWVQTFHSFFWMYAVLCLQVKKWNWNQINTTVVFIYPYIAAKTSVLQYVLHWLHWPHVLSGCLFGHYFFYFLFRQTSAIFISPSMPSGTCVFLGRSRCLNTVFISFLSDDCFPPKKEYSELCTCFRFTLAHVAIH